MEKAESLRHLGDLHVALRKYRRAAMVYETADLFASPATPLDADSTPPPARPKLVTLPPQPTAEGDTASEGDHHDVASARPLTYLGAPSNGRAPHAFSLKRIQAPTSSHPELNPQPHRQR